MEGRNDSGGVHPGAVLPEVVPAGGGPETLCPGGLDVLSRAGGERPPVCGPSLRVHFHWYLSKLAVITATPMMLLEIATLSFF